MKTFIWGDTETSGLGPNAGVVEIAWIETDSNFNVIRCYRSLINPEVKIQFGAMSIHGITEDMVADQPTIQRFMEDNGFPLAGENKILCCHNVQFDRQFFGPWMSPDMQTLCTLKAARVVYPEAENHKLQTLKYMFGLQGDHDKAHTALEDASVMMQLAKIMCRDAGCGLVELLHIQSIPQVITKMTFGMHKGTKLEELPKSYVTWLLTKCKTLNDDLRAALLKL